MSLWTSALPSVFLPFLFFPSFILWGLVFLRYHTGPTDDAKHVLYAVMNQFLYLFIQLPQYHCDRPTRVFGASCGHSCKQLHSYHVSNMRIAGRTETCFDVYANSPCHRARDNLSGVSRGLVRRGRYIPTRTLGTRKHTFKPIPNSESIQS